jgi:hypothetical protein
MTTNLLRTVALCAAAACLAGCQADQPTPDSPPELEGEAVDPIDGVQVTLGVDRVSYAPGDTILAVVGLANWTDQSRTLHFRSAQRFDFVLQDEGGTEVYRWSQDQSFAQVLGEEILEGGTSGPEWEARIPAPSSPGAYRLRAVITAEEADLAAEVPVEVAETGANGR